MPEHGVEIPLWGGDWRSLGLSADLIADLRDWQSMFEASFRPRRRWKAVKDEWATTGGTLAERIRRELPADVTLSVDLWPLDSAR